MNILRILILFGVFQGVLSIIAINSLPKQNRPANIWLSIFVFFINFNLLQHIIPTYGITKITIRILLNIVFSSYGPVFYLYVNQLIRPSPLPFKKWRLHFIPALCYFVFLVFYLFSQEPSDLFFAISSIGILVHASTYTAKSYWLIQNFKKQVKKIQIYIRYLQTIILLIAVCLSVFLGSLIFKFVTNTSYQEEYLNYDPTLTVLALCNCALGYFLMFNPLIFKYLSTSNEETSLSQAMLKQVLPNKKQIDENELKIWKHQLMQLMEKEKPYLRPRLSLEDLATLMDLDKSTLSKVIHEGFKLNFYDFVNSYRVEYFITLTQNSKYQHYTLLGLAYESGFHAKSTFHKAFKKIKNTTPGAYQMTLSKKRS
ncbi:MAG TPA: hypothetical protein DCS93_42265 [Microscillaceae bacterium]|nr:hypothetical protein [Microscillaceae bacterium]